MEQTFPRLLLAHAAQRPHAPALREKELGIWQTLDWAALAALVRDLAHGFAAAGMTRGQHLVVIGENRPRLYASMLAAQSLGAIPVPLYQDAVAAEFAFPLQNADVAFAVVEDQEQVDKLLEIRAACPALRRIWSAYEENRDLILMGAYAPGGDPLIDEAIVRRPEILDFLKQAPAARASFADSVGTLIGMFGHE